MSRSIDVRPRRRTRRARFACLASLALVASCGLDARPTNVRHTLQADTLTALAESPEALARVEALLVEGFGQPLAPRYPALDDWVAARFDPAHPERAAGEGGTGELDAARLAALRADNERRFARELAAIARGAFDDVDVPRAHEELHARFLATADLPDPERRGVARELYAGFYPSLAESAELFRIECAHCHGPSGGGDGPTARFIDPRPRDFRRGVFKWTSVSDGARPTREDLRRVITRGVHGTSMPAFARLGESEREGLVDLVRLLALRGEVERDLVLAHEDGEELDASSFADAVASVDARWRRAESKVVAWSGPIPPATAEDLALGERLFRDPAKGNCSACHGDDGRGDGPVAFRVDARGRKVPAYQDAWGFDIRPRDLRREPLRGGRRPIDIYRRIHAGINGGPMPSLANVLDARETWALVHYTRALTVGGDDGEPQRAPGAR